MNDALWVVFKALLLSHGKLTQAEYNRNPFFNDAHPAHQAEENAIDYLQNNHPELYDNIVGGEKK